MLLTVVALLAAGSVGAGAQAQRPAAVAGSCAVETVAEHELRTAEGHAIYIEPNAIAVSGGEILLAGGLNHVLRSQPRLSRVPTDVLLGAVVRRDGETTLVPAPAGIAQVWAPRALPRAGGGWDVVFADVRDTQVAELDSVAGLWHGVLEGGRWTSVQQIPIPASIWLNGRGTSQLARAGDTLIWVLPGPTAYHRKAVVARRVEGRWTSALREIGSASYVAMAHHRRHGAWLAIVRGPAPRTPGGAMSLYLEPLDGGEGDAMLVDPGDVDATHPSLTATEDGFVVAWKVDGHEGSRLVATEVVPGLEPLPAGEIEPVTSRFRPVAPVGSPAALRWVVQHEPAGGAPDEIRILEGDVTDPREIARLENPFFHGRFVAAAPSTDEIILGGPVPHGEVPMVHVQRHRIRCVGGPPTQR